MLLHLVVFSAREEDVVKRVTMNTSTHNLFSLFVDDQRPTHWKAFVARTPSVDLSWLIRKFQSLHRPFASLNLCHCRCHTAQ